MAPSTLLMVPGELLVACGDGSLRCCAKLAATNREIRSKLQAAAASRGLRLATTDLRQVWKITKQLRGSFHIGELVLSTDVWPFTDVAQGGPLLELWGHCEKLHTIWVNPKYADKVRGLYSDFGPMSDELKSMAERDELKILARPVKMKVHVLTQLKITDMKFLLHEHVD
jgi:hypothetical protein